MRLHAPFQSIYRENFEVVEEVRGNQRLYPHTDQLPLLSRALNLEFYGALPQRIASTDHRADPYRKLLLYQAASLFCNIVNADRQDRVRLFPCCTADLVGKVGLVQQITTRHPLGNHHAFRLFTGDDFLPNVHLNGKRVVFATHALDRFSSRAEHLGDHVVDLLFTLFHSPGLVMRLSRGQGIVCDHQGSMIALPMEDHGDEYFFTTCLTPPEINTLQMDTPPRVMYFHHGREFTPPSDTNLDSKGLAARIHRCWKDQIPFTVIAPECLKRFARRWRVLAARLSDYTVRCGYQEGTYMEFVDNIYGPAVLFCNVESEEDNNDEVSATASVAAAAS